MKSYYDFQTPLGVIRIVENGCGIAEILLVGRGKAAAPEGSDPMNAPALPDGYVMAETQLIRTAVTQLQEYFSGSRKKFDLPLAPEGTPFQQQVWEALCAIPFGHTRTYGQIAAAVGNSKASRAVGMANNRNPLLIVVPCHRVIGAGGKLVGYACGLDKKEFLLDLEQRCAQ